MWAYLTLLAFPAMSAAADRAGQPQRRGIYIGAFILFLLFAGLRHHVGCDWNNYLLMFRRAQLSPPLEAMTIGTPAYMLLNWVIAWLGLGFAWVNLVSAGILFSGVLAFLKFQPRRWLGLLIAVPVLLAIAGFGPNRQCITVGILLWILYFYLKNGRVSYSLFAVAPLFHISAILFLPLPLLLLMRRKEALPMPVAALLGVLPGLALCLVPFASADFADYITRVEPSGGAWLRFSLTAAALTAVLLLRRRLKLGAPEERVAAYFVGLAVFSAVCGLLSSTFTDRLGFYLVPLQILVFTRLADVSAKRAARLAVQAGVTVAYLVMFVGWLDFTNAKSCLAPYTSYLTEVELIHPKHTPFDYSTRSVGGDPQWILPCGPAARADSCGSAAPAHPSKRP